MNDLLTAIKHPLRSCRTALRFLTILPAGSTKQEEPSGFAAALFFFTPVGIIIGLLTAFCGVGLSLISAPLVYGALLAILLSGISGFLHLDGLADTADGFLSARSRDRCLEIMKDSRIGVMGAVAIGSVLLLKTTAIGAIDQRNLFAALVVAPAAGRTALVLAMYYLPYGRPEGGLGQLFQGSTRSVWPVFSSVGLLLITMVLLLPGRMGLVIVVFLLVLIIFNLICCKRIGGYTGDTLGGLCEIMETAVLLASGLII